MGSGRRRQVQCTLVVGTHSGETEILVPSPDQPSPPTTLRHDLQSNQAGTNSPSPISTFSAHALPMDSSVADPTIPAPLVLAQVPGPAVEGAGGRRADTTCTGCRKKMTEAALWRHRTHSCSAKARKRQFVCQACPKSYTRSDALKRHLKTCPGRSLRAATPSASSSSSGSSGVLNTDFPVLPQTPHALNLLESFSTPIAPTPAGGSLFSHVQPQPPPTRYANYSLYTTNHELRTGRDPSSIVQYDHSPRHAAPHQIYSCRQGTTGYNSSLLPHQFASGPALIQDPSPEPDHHSIQDQEAAIGPDARSIGINSRIAHLQNNPLQDFDWLFHLD